MDYQYIGVICVLVVFACLSAFKLSVDPYANWPIVPLCVGAFSALLLFLHGVESHIVVSRETRQVEVSKTFDHIALKAADWPEYFTTDFNTLEKPVNLVKTVMVNHYGLGEWTQWSYEIIPVEER